MIRKFVCPEVVFGEECLPHAAIYARNLALRHVLIVTDPGVVAAGWLGVIQEALRGAQIAFEVFDQVTPNPKMEEVMLGARFFREFACDGILALGGGSPMDCAKGIAIVATNHRHVRDFEGVDRVSIPMPPLICLPTTAGSSADVSQFAIISDTERRVKMAIISKAVVPDVAIIDPVTLTTMDGYLAACTGIDALVHAIEAYVSNAHSDFTDPYALRAIGRVRESLLASIEAPHELRHRRAMMLASLEAGLAFSNASLGLVHAMAHSLGGYLELAHGECNALLLEHVIRFNFPAAEERYRTIAGLLAPGAETLPTESVCDALVGSITRLRQAVGIEGGLAKRAVTPDLVPRLAGFAFRDACVFTNPRKPTEAEIETIFRKAL